LTRDYDTESRLWSPGQEAFHAAASVAGDTLESLF